MGITNEHYRKQYEQMHVRGFFPGKQPIKQWNEINELIERFKPKTLLDYGCGKARCYTEVKIHEKWGVMPVLYDPYHPPYSVKPTGKFEGVICTDVLEHVPEEDIYDVLEDIFSYATSFVYLSISTKVAKKNLPNGENCHVTVKPKEWWIPQIHKAIKKHKVIAGLRFVDV